MPLIKDEGVVPHDWRLATQKDDLTYSAHVIAPMDRMDELLDGQAGSPVGLALANDVDLSLVAPHFAALELITVAFPSFADGRGFSLAQRIRTKGFNGELWAAGHVIPDQYAFARTCGFDAIWVDDDVFVRQTESDWQNAAESLSLSYQRPANAWKQAPRSIMDLRQAARAELAAQPPDGEAEGLGGGIGHQVRWRRRFKKSNRPRVFWPVCGSSATVWRVLNSFVR